MASGSVSTLGLGSSLDLQGILDQLRAADQVTVVGIETRQIQYKDQLAEFGAVNTRLLAVKSLALDLTLNDTYDTKTVTSSNSSVFTASVTSSAAAGGYDMNVTSLAKQNSWQSSGVASATTAIASGAGNYTYLVDGKQTSVAVTAATTLQDLVDAINEDTNNPGVTASVMDDGTGSATAFHLVLLSDETGEANAVSQDYSQSSGVSYASSIVASGAGNFIYTVDGNQTTVAVDATTTLQDLADAINADLSNPGVTASVVNDGSGGATAYHLALVPNVNGQAITIDTNGTDLTFSGTNDTDLTFTEKQAAGTLNAAVVINNISYQRSDNNIDDILTGVTLVLTGTGTSSLAIASDVSSIKDKIVGMVEVYNEALAEIATNSSYDVDTKTAGSLWGVSSFKNIVSQLNQIMTKTISGLSGEYSSLIDLGIVIERDGTFSVDEVVLDTALNTNPEDVKELLLGNLDEGIDGIAELLNDQLRDLTKATSGLIASESSRVEDAIDRLGDDIVSANARLDARYEVLRLQFVQLDSLLSSFQKQQEYLTETFAGMSDMWGNGSK